MKNFSLIYIRLPIVVKEVDCVYSDEQTNIQPRTTKYMDVQVKNMVKCVGQFLK